MGIDMGEMGPCEEEKCRVGPVGEKFGWRGLGGWDCTYNGCGRRVSLRLLVLHIYCTYTYCSLPDGESGWYWKKRKRLLEFCAYEGGKIPN